VIAFHAAFQSNNTIATATSLGLAVVVLTGVVGRFIFSLIPSSEGREQALGELSARWERLKLRVKKISQESTDVLRLSTLMELAMVKPSGTLLAQLMGLPMQRLRDASQLRAVRPMFKKREQHREFVQAFHRMRALQVQVGFFKSLKRLMSVWRVLHVVLAVLLIFLIAAHISVSLYLGYTWIFR
jgi:dihydropyrimidine dehydrogenase (NAD+) subunit PreT